jgi:serine/threonine-protein kinase
MKVLERASLAPGLEPHPGYRLVGRLGKGGFGEVWEACKSDGTSVALKFVPGNNAMRASQETRSLQLVRNLRHPGLVTVNGVWCSMGYVVVAMELAEGTLQDLYDAYQSEYGTPVPAEHLWLLLEQAAETLDFLNGHRHMIGGQRLGIQHCDVKPSNLLLFGERVKVSDFGLAAPTTAPLKFHCPAGTLAYVAPEVFQGRLSDRTDQYALAVTYCMLRCGRLPFGETPDRFSLGYVRPAPDLSFLPQAERPVIARGLAPIPAERWSSCTELIAQLKKIGSQAPPTPLPRLPDHVTTDRRASLRFSCGLRTSARLLGETSKEVWETRIHNVSQNGVGLLCTSPFKRGTVLVVRMPEAATFHVQSLFARVVHASPRDDGGWLIGCTLARRLSEEQVQALARAQGA